jgi:hypothetical protein
LASVYADDPSQHQNVVNYLENLRLQDFSSTTTGLEPLLAGHETLRIAGSDSCTTCHKPDADVWHQSHHAHAWPTLVAKHYEVDPSCQQCHTTGYGLPGGFASAKRGSNVDVGCEDCHGPSQSHVADPKNHTLYRAADQCVRCHDAENSPTFQYETFYPKIAHGKHPATDPAGGG